MKTLFFDCSMGAAGDMIVSALLELLPEPEAFVQKFNSLDIHRLGTGNIKLHAERVSRCGICGTHARMLLELSEHEGEETQETIQDLHHNHEVSEHNSCEHEEVHNHEHHHHEHSSASGHVHGMKMSDISNVLNQIEISDSVRQHCLAIFKLIASAESHVHGCSIEQIHFHEVGQLDALADILASCMLFEELSPDCIIASPICTGKGTVQCAHGILPVPAPATAHILLGKPCFQGKIESEMCTPTGAAILVHFVNKFAEMPLMMPEKIGYGMGSREFADTINALRTILGTQEENDSVSDMVELHVNVDDMTGEQIGFALNKLLDEGANDVWTIPIMMKKGRPAQTLACLIPSSKTDKFAKLLLQYTTSFGVRMFPCHRLSLTKTIHSIKTEYGVFHKKSSSDYNISKSKWEYDDLAQAASRLNISIVDLVDWLNSHS